MSFWAFCDSLYYDPVQIMRYEIFVINGIIEQKIFKETQYLVSDINRWYSNKIRYIKKKVP